LKNQTTLLQLIKNVHSCLSFSKIAKDCALAQVFFCFIPLLYHKRDK
jgi:hypothetical protein